MLKNYLTIALRNLRKHKGYAAINVFGLAVGMACCLMILLLVRHEWSFDRFHTNAYRIYRVLIQETLPDGTLDHRNLMPPPLAPAMAEEFPGIEHLTRVVIGQRDVRLGDDLYPEQLMMVDSTFLDIFTFPLLAGDATTALDDPQNVVLPEPTARKYFGATDERVLGRTLSIERGENSYEFIVSGVLAPLPKTSSLQFDVMLSMRQYETLPIGSNDWGGRTSLYLLLDEDQDPAALEAALPPFTALQFADRIEERREEGYIAQGAEAFRLVLQPLQQLHLEPDKNVNYETEPTDPLYSYILAGIALLVLLIACINFMSLSIGRSTSRAREVGMRKVLGAQRAQLMQQFWGEALLLSLMALVLGLLLVELALPTFNALTGKEFTFGHLITGKNLLALGGLLGVVGLVAGGYPAAVLSRFQPAKVLKGQARTKGHNRLTSSLVVVQYAISIALIICTLVMYRQLDFLLTKDLGFEGDQIVAVQTPRLTGAQERSILSIFRNELAGQDHIENIVKTAYSFTRSYDTFGWMAADGTSFETHNFGVDFDYLDMLGMRLVAGRNFSRDFPTDSTQSVIVNEAFVRKYNIQNPVGYTLTGLEEDSFFGGNPTIIGVVEDFNFVSLHDEVEPAMLNMHPNYYMGMNALLVKVQPDPQQPDAPFASSVAAMERTWKQVFPDKPFAYSFLDADMEAQYETEARWRAILTDAALLAILIACLGLFGLATLTIARRTKEIGIRKVLGASAPGLALLVAREFAVLVGIAILVAAPLAYVAMHKWLQNFAYHVDISGWIFLVAGLAALLVAMVTVSYQALKAALADPVKSLRYE